MGGCAQWSSEVSLGVSRLEIEGFQQAPSPSALKSWVKHPPGLSGATVPVLHVYMEGDGATWLAQRWPPTDPTPQTSVALPLALTDPHPSVAYLGRPCQFLTATARTSCPVAWWTSHRWSDAVVDLTSAALDELLRISGATRLVLTGHSGGGTLAVLVAARRQDVRCVATIASPLDTQHWTHSHAVSALPDSLNPADVSAQLIGLRVRYLFGADDSIAPVSSLGRHAARVLPDQVLVVPTLGHSRGWVAWWRHDPPHHEGFSRWLQNCLNPT